MIALLDGIVATNVGSLIASYGFPIVACCAMGWYVKDNTQKQREEIERINNTHREELKHVTEALNNNTLALQKLCERLGEEL